MADVLEVVLSGNTIKLFTKALTSLAKIGALPPRPYPRRHTHTAHTPR